MFLSKLNITSKLSKKLIAFIAVTMVATLSITAAVIAGYGPNRPTFDWNNPEQRKGSLNGPVFNSFINTPTYGDERAFVDAKDAVITQEGGFKDQVPVENGKEYLVRIYVHNNANQSTNESGQGVAKNTRVRVKIPEGMANGIGLTGYISADNATPQMVYDTVDFRNEQKAFKLEYVPGSARIQNQANLGGLPLSDAIVSDQGVQIGYDQMNGNLPGCFEYSAYVNIKVRVVAPELQIQKKARLAGQQEWQESVDTKPGDTVQWLVEVKNTGNTVQNDVVANDLLPPHVQYVENTAKWYSQSQNGVAYDFNQFKRNEGNGGYNFGNYAANGGGFLVRFDTKVLDDFEECEITIRNIANTYSKQNPTEQKDHADVKITKENCQPDNPVYSCTSLSATSLGDRRFKYTVNYNAQKATLKNVKYNFGDGSDVLLTDKTTVEYQYSKDGQFKTTAVLTFDVNGQEKVVTDEDCATTVSTTTPSNNCPIPGKENLPADSPECSLPNTGAGQLFGLFAATTVAGAAAHHVFTTRKSSL